MPVDIHICTTCRPRKQCYNTGLHNAQGISASIRRSVHPPTRRLSVQFVAAARVCIPGLPFPGCPGMPAIFHSRIPRNGTTSSPWKMGTVQLLVLLSFSACLSRPWYSDAYG